MIWVQSDASGYSAPALRTGVDWQFLFAYVTPIEWLFVIVAMFLLIALAAHDPILKYDEISVGKINLIVYCLIGAAFGLVISLVRWITA